MSLENKVGIVTGASQGIGESIALALAREQAVVILIDVQKQHHFCMAIKLSHLFSGYGIPHADRLVFSGKTPLSDQAPIVSTQVLSRVLVRVRARVRIPTGAEGR